MTDWSSSCGSCETPLASGPGEPSRAAGGLAFKIHGMDCAEEVAVLKRALSSFVNEEDLEFDVLNGRMTVRAAVDGRAIEEAVAVTGMSAVPWASGTGSEQRRGLTRRDWLVLSSVLSTIGGFATHAAIDGVTAAIGSEGAGLGHTVPWAARAVYLVAVGSGLWVVLPKAWHALRTLRPDMNLLMSVAVAGAITIGEWFEASTVSALFALSLALEAWSVGRARRAVEALMNLAPDTVRLRTQDGTDLDVSPESVAVGTPFFVLPGERIGLDGRVVAGASEIDQAPITGESVPVDKTVGDDVFAGTINGSGALEVVSTQPAGDTTLARIVRQVSDSQANRAQSERFVEKFARIYTPAIFLLALLVAIVPPVLFGAPSGDWMYRALVLLVIGCPCALVISTPVAIVASLAASARHGVLLKGGRVAEVPASITVVALDKTGTLTKGQPSVVRVVPINGHEDRELLERAAALERHSTHPIAGAILSRAAEMGIQPAPAVDVVAIPGKGVHGLINGRAFWLGSHRLLEEKGQEEPEHHRALETLASSGRSVVVVGNETHVCGFIAVADDVRPESRAALAALRSAGVAKVVMLTGDNRETAEAVGGRVGIDEVHAELLPEDKVAVVERLELEVGPVAMIGDGVNDAPALARATLGVAMGAAGTDVAIETADIALMGDDLSKLAWLVGHSRATLSIIRANTVLALGIKVVFVALTFGGLATLWAAVAADMGAALLVVANSLRLLRR